MDQRTRDPDYTLRWPPGIFAEELRRLIGRAEDFGTDSDWDDEIETLLRQAFSSSVPVQDLRRVRATVNPAPAGYDPAEEPF